MDINLPGYLYFSQYPPKGISDTLGKTILRDIRSDNSMGYYNLSANISIMFPFISLEDQPTQYRGKQLFYDESSIILNSEISVNFQGNKLIALLGFFGGLSRDENEDRDSKYDLPFSGKVLSKAIDYIESQRHGNDVRLFFDLHMVILRIGYYVIQNEHQQLIPVPKSDKRSYNSLSTRWTDINIPASTWINEYLTNWQYNGPHYMELPRFPITPTGESSRQHLSSAVQALKTGGAGYRSVPSCCLNALDAMCKSLGYSNFAEIPEITKNIFPITEERGKVFNAFRNYLNRWRHDNTNTGGTVETIPVITWEEAAFIYVTTLSIYELLSKNLQHKT